MIEHFHWHQQQRLKYLTSREDFFANTNTNANSTNTIIDDDNNNNENERPFVKFLILQCTTRSINNGKCGGLSDRLKPLPLLILGAYESKRILLIRWRDKPTKLENFFLPPLQETTTTTTDTNENDRRPIFDWTIPDWLEREYLDSDKIKRKHIYNVKPFMKQLTMGSSSNNNIPIITTTLQWWDGGEQAYKDYLNLNRTDDEFRKIYHDLFFGVLFQPTKPIQNILQNIYSTTNLKGPNQYSVAHYRANWWEKQDLPTQSEIDNTAINSIRCANSLQPNLPIYFATDNKDAQKSILNYINNNATTTTTSRSSGNNNNKMKNIVVIPHKELLHLDRVPSNTSLEELYPIFVDLLLLANGNCISYGDGGFGKFGLMISSNYNCYKQHIYRHKIKHCD